MQKLGPLEEILKTQFWKRSTRKLLEGTRESILMQRSEYLELVSKESIQEERQYTQEELSNQWSYYCRQMREDRRKRGLTSAEIPEERMNPMDCLFYYAKKMLTIQDNEVVCRYRKLLEWQMMTMNISETLMVAAFWAVQKAPEDITEREYGWKLVLGHDNYQLNRILQQDMAENHFHLYGSAPIFHLSWISLMNSIINAKAAKKLREYDVRRVNIQKKEDAHRPEIPLVYQHYQAALIRLLLFSQAFGQRVRIGSYQVDLEEYLDLLSADAKYCLLKRLKNQDTSIQDTVEHESDEVVLQRLRKYLKKNGPHMIDMEELEELGICPRQRALFLELWRKRTIDNTYLLLRTENAANEIFKQYQLQEEILNIQSTIDALRHQGQGEVCDYALLGVPNRYKESNEIFEGERWLLHYCLREIYTQRFQEYENLFYIYLLLKENIRHELVQTDDKAGFSHFQDYERRKFDLLDDALFHGASSAMAREAVQENLFDRSIRSLEIRVTPAETAEKNLKMIKHLDSIISGEDRRKEKKEKYFYTIHFLKKEDNWKESDPEAFYGRHYELRQRLMRYTNALVGMRERYPEQAKRILGIDAASKETTCRPEVFAFAFRYLHGHIYTIKSANGPETLPQLRRTYHVGEEFWDLVDGLRAIDEAINFLELESGDRIGHALALGVRSEDWYCSKGNIITISRQDYLDNVMWLYHQLVRFHVPGTEALKEFLKNEFNVEFSLLYLKNMDQDVVSSILEDYNRYRLDRGWEPLKNAQLKFDITQYHRAWKLRGDSPELYRKGYFSWVEGKNSWADAKVTKCFPRHFQVREIPEAFILNYFYHFNKDIREAGQTIIKRRIEKFYIEGVDLVQREMQWVIGRKGIAIETNPTSNFKISTFNGYDKHPILELYNWELERNSENLERCPQLLVSINTDDQGIFSTSLKNEYSLMACALEKMKDEGGKYIYPKQRVYAWLDAVRKMGLNQSFSQEKQDETKTYLDQWDEWERLERYRK